MRVIRFWQLVIIDANALNANGFTALDVLAQSKRDIKDWEIGELIRRAGAYRAKDVQLSASEQTNSLISLESNSQNQQGKGLENSTKKLEDDWLEKMRNAIMVVASLIAAWLSKLVRTLLNSPWHDTSSSSCRHQQLHIVTPAFYCSIPLVFWVLWAFYYCS